MRITRFALLLVALSLASACADSSGSLTPTTLGGARANGSGAVVTGTVQSPVTSLAASNGGGPGTLTIQVIGSGVSTTTGPAGDFTLNIPAGEIELRFSGTGVDARLVLGQVSAGETISIVVQVAGSNAAIRTMNRSGNGEARVHGAVERLNGTASAFTFFIGTREVRGGGQTQFTGEGSSSQGFANLRNGRVVEVRGAFSGEVLMAARVHLDDEDDDDDVDDDDGDDEDANQVGEVEVEGAVSNLSPVIGCPSVTFVVGRQNVFTTNATVFERIACNGLTNGARVEVKGSRESNGSVRARKVERED